MVDQTAAGSNQNQQVLRTLQALNVVVRSPVPVTGLHLGEVLGIHQTSASRLLRSLAAAGYCVEIPGSGYVPDLQVFALGADAVESFPIVPRYRPVITELSLRDPALDITLVTLHNGSPLYFLRTLAGRPVPFMSRRYPLHLSVASLRLLLMAPPAEALALLEREAAHGDWSRPTSATPATPEEALTLARQHLLRDSLIISGWLARNHIAGAVPVALPHRSQFVLSISTTTDHLTPEKLADVLAGYRATIEAR